MRDRALGETWATYLSAARRAAGMSKSELAKVAQVGRATVFRWEAGESRPEQAEIVARVADVLGVDLDEALAAAGLRPSSAPPERPARQEVPMDPDVQIILRRLADPKVSQQEKMLIRAQLRYLADLADRADRARQDT